MDLQFYGANCIAVTIKGTRFVIDDNLVGLGGKAVVKPGDIALYSSVHKGKTVAKQVFDYPGEYEVAGILVYGIPAQAHMDETGTHGATMYKIMTNELTIFFPGHIYPELSDAQLEAIGMVDVMCVPVGGSGYTLDPVGALKLIRKVEPKLVIPTHYADKTLNYPVPQQELDNAIKEMAMEPRERVTKLRVKDTDLPDIAQLVVLEKS